MPIYVYRCRKCDATEEHIQRISDPPIIKCSACGGKLEKAITSAAFHLKGGGWYKDGYASARPEGSSSEASSSEGSSSEGSSGAEASPAAEASDAKPKADKKKPKEAKGAKASKAKAKDP
jgi:putative FmdB family regulatory protein